MAEGAKPRWRGVIIAGLVVVFLIAALAKAIHETHHFVQAVEELWQDPVRLVLCLLAMLAATTFAYVCFTLAMTAVSRAASYRVGFADLVPTSFVSQAWNNLVSTAGTVGIAVRIYGLGALGISPGAAVGVSLGTTLSSDACIVAGIIPGLVWLAESRGLSHHTQVHLLFGALMVSLVAAGLTIALRDPGRRDWLAGWISDRASGVLAKGSREMLSAARRDLVAVLGTFFRKPHKAVTPVFWSLVDLVFRMVALEAAFYAAGRPQPWPKLATGFLLGTFFGGISLVPGGLGVLEGVMVGAFILMSPPEDRDSMRWVATTAVILYRFIYYVVPFAVVSLLFRGFLRAQKAAQPASGDDKGTHPTLQ